MTTKPQLICSICQRPIPAVMGWAGGNNAQPVNDGRCCHDCDAMIVIPARIRMEQQARGKEVKK